MIFIPPWHGETSHGMIERERKPYGRRGTRFTRSHEKKTSRLPKWRGISLPFSFFLRFLLFFLSTEAFYWDLFLI